MFKVQFSVIDAIATHLDTHVMNGHSLRWLQAILADADQDGVHTFVLALHNCLCKDNGPFRMDRGLSGERVGQEGRGDSKGMCNITS